MAEVEKRAMPWTVADLDRLRAFAGRPVGEIAEAMGRTPEDIMERLALIRGDTTLPSYGPDEEGEAPVARNARFDDTAGWVHLDPDL
jgi:hypothetical protein